MARNPAILSTIPKNYSTNIPINSSITVEFSTSLDQAYIADNIYLTDASGKRVEGRYTFRRQVLTFTPLNPLDNNMSYTFTMLGDNDLEDGIVHGLRGIVGEPLLGTHTVLFTTEVGELIEPPAGIMPQADSILRQTPTFSWEPSEAAVSYELQISRFNTFETLVYPEGDVIPLLATSIEPNVDWEDGIYYWRIRSKREDGKFSTWSPRYQFHLTREEEGTISEDDTPDVDVFFEEGNIELEHIEAFPVNLSIDVPTNVQSIYFRVIGTIDASLIEPDSFKIFGTHITGDDYEESHGELKGKLSVVNNDDGTTYLIFTPDALEDEETQVPDETAGEA